MVGHSTSVCGLLWALICSTLRRKPDLGFRRLRFSLYGAIPKPARRDILTMESSRSAPPTEQRNVYIALTLVIQAILGVGLVWFIVRRDWENVFLTSAVIGLTLLPAFAWRRYRVYLPPEFQLI